MKKSPKMQCAIAVSLFRGLYARVADALGMDASYVSRIARGLRRSRVAETALTKEFNRVLSVIGRNPQSDPHAARPTVDSFQETR